MGLPKCKHGPEVISMCTIANMGAVWGEMVTLTLMGTSSVVRRAKLAGKIFAEFYCNFFGFFNKQELNFLEATLYQKT